MLILLSWLVLTPVFASSSLVSATPRVFTEVTNPDTIAEPPLVLLTDSLVTRYVAVQTAVFAVLRQDTAVMAALQTHGHHVLVTFQGPGGMVQDQKVFLFPDFVALAATRPAVAARFRQQRFTSSQLVSVTIAIYKALFAEWLHEVQGWPVKDPESVAGKNMAFVTAHPQAFVGLGLAIYLPDAPRNGEVAGGDSSP